MEDRRTHNRRHPGRSIIKKALQARSPGLILLQSSYRGMDGGFAKPVTRCDANRQRTHGDQDHRSTPASPARASQIWET